MSQSLDRKPLTAELILDVLKKQEHQRDLSRKRSNWYWGSVNCSILLGFCHLFFGTLLLIYDLSTNSITRSAFAVSSSLCFILCAILLFISARRIGLDRPAHYLIIVFSIGACIMSALLIVETTLNVNAICIAVQTNNCTFITGLIHVFLVFIVLLELLPCFLSIYASYHYLQRLSNQITNLIYKSLITEDFSRLPKSRPDEQISLIMVEDSSLPSAPSSLKTA